MDFITTPRTNREELYAYFVLKNFLFKDKQTFVGDSGGDFGEPDLMTTDSKVGCEVTACETQKGFQVANKLFGALKDSNFDYSNLKFLCSNNIYKRSKKNQKVCFKFHQEQITVNQNSENILEAFEYVLTKKMLKLNSGSYFAPQKVYLIILSDFVPKNIKIRDYKIVYDRVCKIFQKHFVGIFITLNNRLFLFDKNGEINLITDKKTLLQQKKNLNYVVSGMEYSK